MKTIDVCFSPALYPAYHQAESIVVVTDIFRATTTIVTAFHNGVRTIRPVASVEEARIYKGKGWKVGAERQVKRCDFADFGNSPFDYTAERVGGEDLVFTTTNGTKAVTTARDAFRVVAGAFINLQAVADYCLRHGRNVTVLASAWEDKVNIEDCLFGGALAEALLNTGAYQAASDATRIALEMWQTHKHALRSYIEQTDHFARLQANGLADSVDYCLSANITSVVPEIKTEEGLLFFQ